MIHRQPKSILFPYTTLFRSRMERHCFNGRKIAEYLKTHPKIEKIYWPGFTDHPNHEIAKKQMRDFGGMISFVLKDRKSTRLNSSHRCISYAVFCLKKKKKENKMVFTFKYQTNSYICSPKPIMEL